MTIEITRHITSSPEETEAIGALVAKTFVSGDMVGLIGDLGAGKTRFVRGVAQGLGVKGLVKSPSFTLVNVYEGGRIPLYHIDLYRLGSSDELYSAGIEEYIYGDGVSVIEWADSIPDLLDVCTIVIRLSSLGDERRSIEIERRGYGKRQQPCHE
ncbi:MAG: tRNA (adenosine(37)-N6)-threonylcarbamoyltransferase complex ATPase subunit type 1 TsaE [Deltaproteobacteria bacterium]